MIYVVIPVHNRFAFTRQCLSDLARQVNVDFTTIVVDDGSSDGTAEVLAREYPSVVVLGGDGNLWWTAAMNLGVTWALERAAAGDYVLALNNDTRFESDYLESLATAAEDHSPALIGSLAVDQNLGVVVEGGVRMNWLTAKRVVMARGLPLGDVKAWRSPPVGVDVLPGRGALIPVSVFRAVGLFDAVNLPHYGADYEFSRRAARAGFRLLVSYDAVLRVQPTESGLHASRGLRAFLMSFVARRSANELRGRWRFARLTCPRGTLVPFVVLDTIRVVVGSFKRQVLSAK
jgi:GT2 family glycosyltransferase